MKKEKNVKLIDCISLVDWYLNDFSKEKNEKSKLKVLSIKIQWALLNNIKAMEEDYKAFMSFKEKAVINLQKDFMTDEKSFEVAETRFDAAGNPVMDKDGNLVTEIFRKVKNEYMKEYQGKIDELNKEIDNILMEEKVYTFSSIDVDSIVDKLDDDSPITIEDLNFLSFFMF